MTDHDPVVREPSHLPSCLVGYAVGAAVGVGVAVASAAGSGEFRLKDGFAIIFGLGLVGVFVGFKRAVRRRKALGFVGPFDDLKRFYHSPPAFVLAAVLVFASFGLSILAREIAHPAAPKALPAKALADVT
jgi:hypothetical protein